MHNREYTVFLRPYKGGMMLHTMYYKEEVRRPGKFRQSRRRAEGRRSEGGAQLIEALSGDFEPEKYQ